MRAIADMDDLRCFLGSRVRGSDGVMPRKRLPRKRGSGGVMPPQTSSPRTRE